MLGKQCWPVSPVLGHLVCRNRALQDDMECLGSDKGLTQVERVKENGAISV